MGDAIARLRGPPPLMQRRELVLKLKHRRAGPWSSPRRRSGRFGEEDYGEHNGVGVGVGALLLAAALAAPKVDAFIARGQRRDLKLCMECGGVTRIPCVRCKARGTLNQSILSFEGSSKPATCPACRGRGNFPCPSCCGNKSVSSSSL